MCEGIGESFAKSGWVCPNDLLCIGSVDLENDGSFIDKGEAGGGDIGGGCGYFYLPPLKCRTHM